MKAERQAASKAASYAAEQLRKHLDKLEATRRPLDAWQSEMLARAIARFRTGSYALAIEASFKACRPAKYQSRAAAIRLKGSPTLTIAEVRQGLEQVIADKAA